MKKLQGPKTSLAVGALKAQPALRKPANNTSIEIPTFWWDGGGPGEPKMPRYLGE